ncbi:hypothetical protein GCM10023093_09470 [Nemorincola caseinilytica]|uniref:SGNH/GDSL hydrolase family protein n=1 Tax=Nemorincola caseinilytica TaxID=2054315 RepID=A0ABP8NAB4_9BACT
MKRFVYRLVLFCVLPMVALIPLAYMVDAGLQRSRSFLYAEWNDLFAGRIQADMLFMGSSRSWVHFSPQIMDSALGVNTYNLGLDGTPLDLQFERLKIYLRYNKMPKYIVQEVGLNTAMSRSKELPHYEQFLPYLADTAMWRIYSSMYPGVSVADRFFPLYKYNNQLPLIKEGIMSYLGRGVKAVKYKGYEGRLLTWDNAFDEMVRQNPNGMSLAIEPEAIALLNEYVQFCKDNGVRLILVYSPCYYEATAFIKNMDQVMGVLRDMSVKYEVPLLDHTHTYIDSNKAYFYNSQHLNKQGSELFSRMLAQQIAPYIKDTAAHPAGMRQ